MRCKDVTEMGSMQTIEITAGSDAVRSLDFHLSLGNERGVHCTVTVLKVWKTEPGRERR